MTVYSPSEFMSDGRHLGFVSAGLASSMHGDSADGRPIEHHSEHHDMAAPSQHEAAWRTPELPMCLDP